LGAGEGFVPMDNPHSDIKTELCGRDDGSFGSRCQLSKRQWVTVVFSQQSNDKSYSNFSKQCLIRNPAAVWCIEIIFKDHPDETMKQQRSTAKKQHNFSVEPLNHRDVNHFIPHQQFDHIYLNKKDTKRPKMWDVDSFRDNGSDLLSRANKAVSNIWVGLRTEIDTYYIRGTKVYSLTTFEYLVVCHGSGPRTAQSILIHLLKSNMLYYRRISQL